MGNKKQRRKLDELAQAVTEINGAVEAAFQRRQVAAAKAASVTSVRRQVDARVVAKAAEDEAVARYAQRHLAATGRWGEYADLGQTLGGAG